MTQQPQADFFTDLDRLRLASVQAEGRSDSTPKRIAPSPKTKRIKGEFLKGPIPLRWLSAAAQLSGKAPLAVALAVWFQAGRRRSKQVRLTTAVLRRFSISRKAKYGGLKSLEKAGLVDVHREPRRNPVVTILNMNDATEPGSVAGTSPAQPPGPARAT